MREFSFTLSPSLPNYRLNFCPFQVYNILCLSLFLSCSSFLRSLSSSVSSFSLFHVFQIVSLSFSSFSLIVIHFFFQFLKLHVCFSLFKSAFIIILFFFLLFSVFLLISPSFYSGFLFLSIVSLNCVCLYQSIFIF